MHFSKSLFAGMPIAGGLVFLPVLTRVGGLDARTTVAFTAATQTVGVGVLAPLNWLFHDKRVFIRNGSSDLLAITVLPSWLGVAVTWFVDIDQQATFGALTSIMSFYVYWLL